MRQYIRVFVAALAGLVWLLSSTGSVFAQSVPCNANPTDDERSQALQAMGAGVAFIKDPDGARYEEGYPQFKKAYELSCSVNALQNLALCEMNLELDGDAIEHYEIVLQKKTDLAEEDRRQIESDVERLKATVAWITFTADQDDVRLVDERVPNRGAAIRNTYQIGTQQKRIGVHPGLHKFTATSPGGATQTWEIDVASSSSHDHTFTLGSGGGVEQPGPGPGGPGPGPGPVPGGGDEKGGGGFPVYVWVLGGVTVASLITMVALMGASTAKKGTYDDEIVGKKSVEEQQDAAKEIKTLSVAADIFIGVTVAAAAATVILAILQPGEEGAATSDAGPRYGKDYVIAPIVDREGGGAALEIRF